MTNIRMRRHLFLKQFAMNVRLSEIKTSELISEIFWQKGGTFFPSIITVHILFISNSGSSFIMPPRRCYQLKLSNTRLYRKSYTSFKQPMVSKYFIFSGSFPMMLSADESIVFSFSNIVCRFHNSLSCFLFLLLCRLLWYGSAKDTLKKK